MRDPLSAAGSTFPLSTAQFPLWLIDRSLGRHVQQIEGGLLTVPGLIDPDRLRGALDQVTARHPALRIGVEPVAGRPRQRVHSTASCEVAEADFAALAPASARAAVIEWAADLGRRPFELSRPPLWRTGVARLPGGRSVLAVAAHHLICDGWTLRLLLEDTSEQYRTAAAGPPEDPAGPPEAPAGTSYPQCVLDRDEAWRRDPAVLDYWRSVLDDCAAPHVVVPGAVPANGGGGADAARLVVGPEVSRLVREVARRFRTTPFLVFTAAYAATIGSFSGAVRIPVGTAYHGRTAPELKHVAGLFATMFVLDADLTGDPSFGDLLARLRERYRSALAHRTIALEELAMERKLTREPFFRHMISYHPASFAVSRFGGMPAAMELTSGKPTHHELEFHVRELPDSFDLQLRFDPSVLGTGSARTILGAFSQRLASLTAAPAGAVS